MNLNSAFEPQISNADSKMKFGGPLECGMTLGNNAVCCYLSDACTLLKSSMR